MLSVSHVCSSQLSSSSEQFCVSRGKLLKSMEQRAVTVTLKHVRLLLSCCCQGNHNFWSAPTVPDAVEDVSVGVNPQHDVLRGGVVDEGALGMDEEDVGDPDLLHQARVERPAEVGARWKRQPLVFPVVTQVQSHGEILEKKRRKIDVLHWWIHSVSDVRAVEALFTYWCGHNFNGEVWRTIQGMFLIIYCCFGSWMFIHEGKCKYPVMIRWFRATVWQPPLIQLSVCDGMIPVFSGCVFVCRRQTRETLLELSAVNRPHTGKTYTEAAELKAAAQAQSSHSHLSLHEGGHHSLYH